MKNSKHFLGIKPPAQARDGSPKKKQYKTHHGFFAAVQLICAQLLLQENVFKYSICSFEESQLLMYVHHITGKQPMFRHESGGLRVNMDWALHCVNFFRHHIVGQEWGSLRQSMDELDVEERPSAWRTPLENGLSSFPRNWKGTYSYIEQAELDRIRTQGNSEEHFSDRNLEDGESANIQVRYTTAISALRLFHLP